MFSFFKKRREAERQEMLEAFERIAQQNREALDRGMDMLARIADVSAKQTEALTAYLNLFKTPDPPKSHTIRPDDEQKLFLEGQGFPSQGTPQEQMEWLLAQSDFEE